MGKLSGPMLQRRDPSSDKGPRQGVACHGAAWPNGRLVKPRVRCGIAELRSSVAVLYRGEATVHNMKNVVFCFVLLFRYFKDLSIGLMRIL